MEIREVHEPSAPFQPYPSEEEYLDKLVLSTEWGDWSPCSKCGIVGRRHKLGYCLVAFNNEDNETNLESTNLDDLQLLRIFKYGIPCRSHVLPIAIKNTKMINMRKDEVMTSYCKVKCPEKKLFEVRDAHGNIIEKVNNSEGIFSMTQGMPAIEPAVERRLMYGVKGKTIIITCPGNLNSDSPIQWQEGGRTLVAPVIQEQSHGRIYISMMDRIYINKAKVSDSNIYSCWQNDELAGTVRLVVEKKLQMNFNHHIMLFGIMIILLVFLYVFATAYKGRKHARVKSYKRLPSEPEALQGLRNTIQSYLPLMSFCQPSY